MNFVYKFLLAEVALKRCAGCYYKTCKQTGIYGNAVLQKFKAKTILTLLVCNKKEENLLFTDTFCIITSS